MLSPDSKKKERKRMHEYDTVIFCDFDGTITKEETFTGVLMRVCREDDLREWGEKLQKTPR